MGNDIVFTPNDIITVILAISAGIVTLSGAISVIANWINKARQPEYKQNAEIAEIKKQVSELKEKFKEYDNFFKNDDERFNIIEDETKILLKSVHALLKHELDDSDNQVIKDADEKLDAYLLNK